MKYISAHLLPLAVLALFAPSVSSAQSVSATPSIVVTPVSTAQALSAELAHLSLELASTTASFSLMPGQSIMQASSSAADGLLVVSVPAFEHSNPDLSVKNPDPVLQYAKVTLQYMPCAPGGVNACVSSASAAYPLVKSDLQSGPDYRVSPLSCNSHESLKHHGNSPGN